MKEASIYHAVRQACVNAGFVAEGHIRHEIAIAVVRILADDPTLAHCETTSDSHAEPPADLSSAGWLPLHWTRRVDGKGSRIVWVRGSTPNTRPPAPRSRRRSPRV